MQGELIAAGQVPPIKGLPLEVPELVCCQGRCHPASCPCVGAELGREMQCSAAGIGVGHCRAAEN